MTSYFTDGSASPNPGPGGFAVIKNAKPYLIGSEPTRENPLILANGEKIISEISRNYTTNIRMESLALLSALNDFLTSRKNDETCEITTDSEFWINVLTKWAPAWSRNGWQKKGGIKNLDLVKPLFAMWIEAEKLGAKLVWTRGHVGTELNELADEWANAARRRKVCGVVKVGEE